jgi:beta-glucanase (GH16 family)
MCTYRLALVFRSVAIIFFSFAVVSCGSGSGKPTVSSPNGAAEGSPELRLVFEDDFGGPIGAASRNSGAALPASNWRVETGYGSDDDGDGIPDGWGNDEWQNYTNSTDNLYLENGALVISAQCSTGDSCSNVGVNKRTGAITSARINTKEKFNVRYGSVSARIKMPSGVGTWPAFWMLGADIDDLRWPDAGEIDIVEMHYKYSDNKTTHFTTHWSGPNYAEGTAPPCSARIPGVNVGEEQHCYTATKKFDTPLTDDFHVFELVWNENSITGKIDDVTYYTLGIDPATMEEFLKDYFMILNVAVGGTLGGTPSASMDWSNPDQTNMLVDWVRVYDRAQSDTSTLIDESGNNLPYNRIINSAEFGGAFVDSDLDSTAVAPLVGNQVLELDYSTSLSQGGGATADYSAAFFSFNRIDLSNFNNIIFSMDVSQFDNFDNVSVLFEDSGSGAVSVKTSDLTSIATVGNWNTYKIPFSDYAGVAMDDIKFVAFTNPNDVNNSLIGGKLYLDDIRFSQEECTAQGGIEFDSVNYNSDTRVAAVDIDDICAAGSLASIEVDNGSEQVTLGVKLDAAGKGRVIFGLVNNLSVCPVDDQASILPLSGSLTATYAKTLFDEAAVQSTVVVTAQAGVDESAPSTVLAGDELFLYSTDQALSFLPDNDFAYSVFGSESLLDGAVADETFSPSFGVTSGTGYGGGIHVAQIIWLGGETFPQFAGFAESLNSVAFKVKDLPGNKVVVELGLAGAGVDVVTINDVTNSPYSTPIDATGWYQIEIPSTEFPASEGADFLAITGGNGGSSQFTYLITDVSVKRNLKSNVDVSCEALVTDPPGGSSSGGSTSSGGSSSSGGTSSGGGFDGGLIINGDFNSGLTGWSGNAANALDDGGNNVNFADVATVGQPFDVNLSYGLAITQGDTYTLSFKAKSDGNRTMLAGIGLYVDPFTDVTETVNLTADWQTFTLTVTATGFGGADSRVIFDMGADTGQVIIDDVSLFGPGGGSSSGGSTSSGGSSSSGGGFDGGLIINGDFNSGITGWSGNAANAFDDGGNNVNSADVATVGQPFDVNLSYGLAVTQGDTYTLSFKAKSDGNRTMLAGIGLYVDPFTDVTETVNLTADWQTFTLTVTATGFGGADSRVIFDMGADTGLVLIDDVSLVVVGGSSSSGGDTSSSGGGSGLGLIDFEVGGSGSAFAWEVFENDTNPALEFVSNPDASGLNTSETVAKFTARQSGASFAGTLTEDLPTFTLDTTNSIVKIMVYKTVISDVGIKFEKFVGLDPNGLPQKGSTGEIKVANTLTNQWEELTFDFSAVIGIPENIDITGLIIFPDFDARSAENVIYFDNVAVGTESGGGSTSSGGSSSSGGGSSGGLVPEATIYEANGTTADLSPGYDPFGSATGIATVADTSYTQALELTVANGYGPALAQLGLTGLSFTGYDEFLFKVKGLTADNTIRVTAENTGGSSLNIDLTSAPSGVTATDLGDGWTQVIIALTAFGDVSNASQMVFQTLDNAYSLGDTFLLTDIGFNNAGGGNASGGSVPNVTIYEADGTTADLSPGYDPFGSATGIATVADTSYTQALELTVANGYGPALAQLGLTGLALTDYDELLFKVKGLTADNTVKVTLEATGGGIVLVDLTSPPSGVTATDLGDGWTQVVMPFTAFGDASSSTVLIFATLDNAYAVGDTFLLTDIGFNNAAVVNQLAVNGDIEVGDLSSFTVNDNGGSITADNTQDSGSTWSVHVVAGVGNNPSLSLPNLAVGTVMPGDTIDVSFDMCGILEGISGAVKPALLSEFGLGDGATRQDLDNIETLPSVWTRYNYSAAAQSDVTGGVSLQLDVVCGAVAGCAADVHFDNISITIGGGVAPGNASGASCAAPVAPGVTLPIDFETGSYVFGDFNGGQASVEANSQSAGINVSANVGKMIKFVGDGYAGSTLDLGGTLTVPANSSSITMKVWSPRAMPVLFKLEGGTPYEATANHSGGGVWEELTFDFSAFATGDHTGITLFFDPPAIGDAATDSGNWTFYFDDIDFSPAPPAPNVTLFADAFAPGWVGFLDASGAVTVVTDSDSTYGEVLEVTTGGNTVVGIGSRAAIGGDGVNIDTSRFAVLEFDLKLVTAPTSGTTNWRLKVENPGLEVGIDAPVLDTWVRYSIPMSSLGTPNALDLIMLFPDYGANAGAVYRLDNVRLLEEASPPPPEDITLFADVLASGWVEFLDATGAVTVVTDSDSTYGEVLEVATGGNTVVGIGSRAAIGGDGVNIDTSGFAVLEFDLKLVTAPTSGTTNWRLKVENPGLEVGIDAPVLDTWVNYSIPLSSLGTPNALDLIMLFPDYGANAGAVYRLDNVKLMVEGGGDDTATGGSVPDISIYNADVSSADLSPGYNPFDSATGIATVADTSFAQALELTIADGYGPSLAQLGLTGLSLIGYDEFLFKIKGLSADNTINVKAEATGGGLLTIDLTLSSSGVTVTELGDGWTQVVIALTAFGDVSSVSQIVFQTLDNAYPVGDKFLLTDIGFNIAPGGQLAVNGDIEVGDLSSFTVNDNGGSITADNTQDSGSTWSVHVVAGVGNNPSLSLPNLAVGTVMPGDTIDVSFDMCGILEGISGAVKPALLSEFGLGDGATRQDLDNIETLPSVWTRYNYSAAAQSDVTGGVSLQLDVVCGAVAGCAADVHFDNISITIGGGVAPGNASGASCAAPVAPGVTLPIDFETGSYVFGDFNGGQASVEANSQSAGINVSANVGKMIKFVGDGYAGSTLDLGGTLTVPANSSSITMKVWSPRAMPVLFKLEGGTPYEATANHSGGGVWEELTFDFSAFATGDHTGITLFFDPPAIGDAATDSGNWTFYFDDIDFSPAPPAPNVTLFADAFAPGWVGFLDASGAVTVVTDSDSTYGEVLEVTTGGNTVVGIGSRAAIGGDGVNIDTSRFAVLEFDLKLVTAPTSGTTNWRLKVENPGLEVGIDAPVLDTWVRYSIPMSSLGTPNALDLIMLFPDYGANAGAVYRLDNVRLLEEASPPPPEDITLFADVLASGWVEFLDATGAVTVVTDSDSTYGEVLEVATGGNTVVGIGSRAAIGGDGVNIDTSGFAVLEFDLKLVTAPTSGTTNWRLKVENPGLEVGIDAPVLDTWVNYSIPLSSLGTPNALDLIMLFPDYGANAGAVYRLDNVKLLETASPPLIANITLFEDALATGWVEFLDATGSVTVVTDSDSTYGEVLEIATGGNTVVGIGSRAAIGGGGVNIDTSDFAALEFDLKLVTAPTSGTTNWRLKVENPGLEVGIDVPVLDTWVNYSIPLSSLGTPNALDLIMLFPDYGANAGAVYRIDNVELVSGG